MQKTIIALFLSLLLVACSDSAKKVEGAWKSKSIGTLTQKPACLIFDKDSVSTDGDSFKVNYTEEKGVILVKKVGSNYTSFTITPQSNRNELEIETVSTGKQLYIKTTIEDVENIRSTPIDSTQNTFTDPF